MFDWLTESVSLEASLTPTQLAMRLAVSAVYGGCVAIVYRLSYGRHKSDGSALITTLVLLSILIAMVSMVIGDSVARAFSLVGALSIVRFRTVVDDTRDTAFVIFAVIVGMAAGAGLLLVPVLGIPVVGVAACLLNRGRAPGLPAEGSDSLLRIRLGLGRDAAIVLANIFERHFDRYDLTAVETARQGSALDWSYRIRLRPLATMGAVVTELNQVEGVQGVEFRA